MKNFTRTAGARKNYLERLSQVLLYVNLKSGRTIEICVRKTCLHIFTCILFPLQLGAQTVAFKYSTTNGQMSVINHTATDNRPEALLFITQNFGTSGPNYLYPVGVKYENSRWTLAPTNPSVPIPNSTNFNVLVVSKDASCAFQHTSSSNTTAVVLNHTLLNGNPNAKIIVTHNLTNGTTNNKNIAVKFESTRWVIVNEDGSEIPKNARFNVLIADDMQSHTITKSSIHPTFKSTSIVDHASINGRSDALLFVTHVHKGKSIDAPLSVWWDNNKWTFFSTATNLSDSESEVINFYRYTDKTLCGATDLTGRWVSVKNGQIPRGAFQGGMEANGAPLYIVRARHESGLHIGKARKGDDYALIGYGGNEVKKTSYEAYTGIGLWVKANKSKLPAYAVRGGEEANGEAIYIARAKFDGNYHIGKVKRNADAFIPYGGKENVSSSYEVLVYKLETGNVVTGGECYLQNAGNNLCVEPSTYTKKSTDLSLMPYDNEEILQRWVLEAANANGTQFKIFNKFTNNFLRAKVLSTSVTTSGATSTSYWVYRDKDPFQWTVSFGNDGTGKLSWGSGYLMPIGNIYGEGVKLLENTQTSECQWNLLPDNAFSPYISYVGPAVVSAYTQYGGPFTPGLYKLKDNLESGTSYSILLPDKKKNLDAWLAEVEKNGCHIGIWDYVVEGGVHTHWVLERVKNTDVFVIYNAASRKALSLKNAAGEVELRDFAKTSSQFWKIKTSESSTTTVKKYFIYPLRDFGGKMLTINGDQNTNGTLVQLGQKAQEWLFVGNPSLSASCRKKADEYLSGDWDGDGKTDMAIRIDNRILYDYGNNDVMDNEQFFGAGHAEDQYLVGDWDGDGADNIAVRTGVKLLFDTNFDGGEEFSQLFYGSAQVPGEEYLVGDWDGDGRDNVALRQNNTILLDYNFDPKADSKQVYGFGDAEKQYLVGDWNGDGKDNIAVRRGNELHYDFNFNVGVDLKQTFGQTEDQYLVGDWDGNGVDNIAVRFNGLIEMDTDFDKDIEKEATIGCGVNEALRGWVDMHTHPMSHLGFGKKLMHGAPDAGSLIPAGTRDCNSSDFRAKDMKDAMGHCNSTHGGYELNDPFDGDGENTCGDYIRAAVINYGFDSDFVHKSDNPHGDHHHAGYPAFQFWPHQSSKTHQQMWYEWIKRAYDGGLRVMVALSVNSELLATLIKGDAPLDDQATSELQIKEIISFVDRHNDFMEVAKSASDLRRIVKSNRLAIVLGVELDNIGNMNKVSDWNEDKTRLEIKKLYDSGVRYVFPIHLVDNKFGGTAVYSTLFNFANLHSTGQYYEIKQSKDPRVAYSLLLKVEDDGKTYQEGYGFRNTLFLGLKGMLEGLGHLPSECCKWPHESGCGPLNLCCLNNCSHFHTVKNLVTPSPLFESYVATPPGHVNAKGLTPLGEFAIKEMMRLGMLIDIDHMSDSSTTRTLELAQEFGYPVNIGHNGIRQPGGKERDMPLEKVRIVSRLGGMFGMGCTDQKPEDFATNYKLIWEGMCNKAVAIGTDVNGAEKLPRHSDVTDNYDIFYKPEFTKGVNPTSILNKNFSKCKNLEGGREWDYTKEGVAHYGLMWDFFRDVQRFDPEVVNNLFTSAEYFAQMWEKCERRKLDVK